MNRPTRFKARLALAIVAALAAVPTPAIAAVPAGDEYVLEIPGVRPTGGGSVAVPRATDFRASGRGDAQRGVVGETDEPSSPLAALGETIGSVPRSLALGVAAFAALALLVAPPLRRPVPDGPR